MDDQKQRDILNLLPWAVVRFNPELRVIFSNAAARKHFNWKTEEDAGFLHDISWVDQLGEPLAPENHPVVQCFLTGEIISGIRMGFSNPATKNKIWIEAHAVPQFDEGSERPRDVVFTFSESSDLFGAEAKNSYQSLFGQKTLNELEISEKRFRDLFENMAQGFCIIERINPIGNQPVDFRYLSVNPAFEHHTGMHDVVGKTIRELLPDAEQSFFDIYNDVVETGNHHRFESYLSSLGIWIEADVIPTDKPGQIAIWFNNVTERRRLEETLLRRKQLLKDMGKIARVGGWELDCSTMKQEWTDETYAIHDREPGVYDPNSKEELSRFEPGSKELIDKAFEAALTRGEPYDLEVEMTTVKGNRKWIRAVCWPVVHEGKIVKLPGAVQDITERKLTDQKIAKLAERLNLATQSAGIGIWDWNIQKNEIVWDDQMVALYGLQTGNFKGAYEAWLNGVHPDDREESDKISQSAVRGEGEYDTEFRVLWPDGSVHWLKADGRVFRDENGAPVRMVGVNYDITERKLAETNLRDSEQRFSTLFRTNPTPTGITRAVDFRIVEVNNAWCKLTGYSPDEAIGRTSLELGLAEPRTLEKIRNTIQEH